MRSGSGPSRTLPTTSTSTLRRPDRPGVRPGDARALAERLGLTFTDLALLEQALVHSSFTNDHPDSGLRSNQRLEFLGDSVVSLVFSEALFALYPDEPEGLLTARRAALVSTGGLARLGERIGLGEFLLLGEGAERANERRRPSILESTFEAVAGAVFVEFGYEPTREWLVDLAAPELGARPPIASLKSPKSHLLETAQALTGKPPSYRVLSVEGPDHARRYVVEAIVGGTVAGTGSGSSRREAETKAASAALESLPKAAG